MSWHRKPSRQSLITSRCLTTICFLLIILPTSIFSSGNTEACDIFSLLWVSPGSLTLALIPTPSVPCQSWNVILHSSSSFHLSGPIQIPPLPRSLSSPCQLQQTHLSVPNAPTRQPVRRNLVRGFFFSVSWMWFLPLYPQCKCSEFPCVSASLSPF